MALRYALPMCANYVPVTSMDRLLQYFGVVRDRDEPLHDIYPMGLAPFIHLALPGDEKRMVVILEPEDFQGWLTCPVDEAKAKYCRQWQGELVGEPAALPKRSPAAAKAPKAKPKEPPAGSGATGELF